jgi:hypothetical protein
MDFIRANLSTIIVAIVVFGILALVTVNLIRNARKGKSPCGCPSCTNCRSAIKF